MNGSVRRGRRPPLLLVLIAVGLLLGVAVMGRHEAAPGTAIVAAHPVAAAGDRFVATGDLVLASDDVVAHDAIALNGNVVVPEGAVVQHDVVAGNGAITIAGTVDHDVQAANGDITLAATAHVGNDVSALNGEVHRDPGATVGGQVTGAPSTPRRDPGAGIVGFVLRLLVNLVLAVIFVALGTLVVLIWPRTAERVAAVLETASWPAVVVGVLTAVLIMPVAALLSVILAITVVGIILLPFLWLGILAAWVYGGVALGYWVGRRLVASGRIPAAHGSLLLTALSGLALEAALVVVLGTAIPWLGWLTAYFLGFIGLGAAILYRFGSTNALPIVGRSSGPRITHPLAPPPERRAS